MSRSTAHDKPIVILACKVFQHWLEQLLSADQAAHITFFDYGLHAVPKNLRQTIQQAIDTIEPPSLIVLGYGLCGNGLDRINAGKHFLLIPRTDDCIAILLGSYQAYRREMDVSIAMAVTTQRAISKSRCYDTWDTRRRHTRK